MIRTDRTAIHYNENLLGTVISFDNSEAWTISSGTGSAATSTEQSFSGIRSLKLINTAPASDIIATNSTQSAVIPETGTYGFLCYLHKDVAETLTGLVKIFQNAVLLSDQTFSMDVTTDNDKWVRYAMTADLSLTKGDDITFQVQLDGMVTGETSLTVYFDGFMLYAKDRGQQAPPFFTKIERNSDFTSTSVTTTHSALKNEFVLCDATSGAFTVNLPAAATNKNAEIIVKKIDASANAITIDGNGSETIDGALTQSLTSQYDSITLFSDGSNWHIS